MGMTYTRLNYGTTTYQTCLDQHLPQGREELAQVDLLQASEKDWGAAAQMLKADWPNVGAGSMAGTGTGPKLPRLRS